jgi:hypothetical protein
VENMITEHHFLLYRSLDPEERRLRFSIFKEV